jgi:hypothetical protein
MGADKSVRSAPVAKPDETVGAAAARERKRKRGPSKTRLISYEMMRLSLRYYFTPSP